MMKLGKALTTGYAAIADPTSSGKGKDKAGKERSWGLPLDRIMRCRQLFCHAPQLFGASVADLSAER